jgi:hypothetical protein
MLDMIPIHHGSAPNKKGTKFEAYKLHKLSFH